MTVVNCGGTMDAGTCAKMKRTWQCEVSATYEVHSEASTTFVTTGTQVPMEAQRGGGAAASGERGAHVF